MLKLESINKKWGDFRLRHISFDIPQGEFFVLLGPSGAGKSLLLELIAGFHRPDSGRIYINGRNVTALAPEKRGIGFVYQDQMLFPHKNVRQNIAYGLDVRGVNREVVAKKLESLAAMLHLEQLMGRPATALSGGEKQRVGIARALAVDPDLLLLDEPFSSLDPPEKQKLWHELKSLHAQTAITIVHVTHDRAEAIALAQRIGIIQGGCIEQVGADLNVFQQPNSHFVAEFTGGTNIYTGEASSNGALTEFRCGALGLRSTCALEGPCKALVRPENIVVSRQPVETSARNQLGGVVESAVRRGDLYEVNGRFDGCLMTCVVTPESLEELQIAPGAQVYFSFKAGSVHLFKDTSEARRSP